ncbi:MAG: hypothetical protein LBC61_01550 [Candidatus Peribacteria bacterium]|jgi:hypothetical protein|nr:hypothetical protein [Candidatus Peribacteria bacterium]
MIIRIIQSKSLKNHQSVTSNQVHSNKAPSSDFGFELVLFVCGVTSAVKALFSSKNIQIIIKSSFFIFVLVKLSIVFYHNFIKK